MTSASTVRYDTVKTGSITASSAKHPQPSNVVTTFAMNDVTVVTSGTGIIGTVNFWVPPISSTST